jgi:hypothetical protein
MNDIERRIIETAIRLLGTGLKAVTPDQLLTGALPPDDPKARFRPAYSHAVERMLRRGLLSSQWEDTKLIGYIPTSKAYAELGSGSTQS